MWGKEASCKSAAFPKTDDTEGAGMPTRPALLNFMSTECGTTLQDAFAAGAQAVYEDLADGFPCEGTRVQVRHPGTFQEPGDDDIVQQLTVKHVKRGRAGGSRYAKVIFEKPDDLADDALFGFDSLAVRDQKMFGNGLATNSMGAPTPAEWSQKIPKTADYLVGRIGSVAEPAWCPSDIQAACTGASTLKVCLAAIYDLNPAAGGGDLLAFCRCSSFVYSHLMQVHGQRTHVMNLMAADIYKLTEEHAPAFP
jgi:hypothetical protein